VQRAGDARAGQRLARAELGAHGHQARHLVLGEADLLAAVLGQADVGDLERELLGGGRGHGCLLGREKGIGRRGSPLTETSEGLPPDAFRLSPA
jgi:hypothetical protein